MALLHVKSVSERKKEKKRTSVTVNEAKGFHVSVCVCVCGRGRRKIIINVKWCVDNAGYRPPSQMKRTRRHTMGDGSIKR